MTLLRFSVLAASISALANAAVVHYPPNSTNINNLTFAINGTGAPGIFNSSTTPDNLYGIYNWCNMPHVRAREYKTPSRDFTLEYVEIIQRHHKRTPYASNTFFKEDIPWDCIKAGPVTYGKGPDGAAADVSEVQWQAFTNSNNPWTNTVGPGFVNSTCQFPQITPEGITDSHTHGADIRSVYFDRLGLTQVLDPIKFKIRVTNNVITSQVAGGLLKGLFPLSHDAAQALIQSSNFDSLEPTYRCPNADSIRSAYTSNTNANWTAHLDAASALYDKLDKVSGIARSDSAGWHTSFDHYYDNMSAKQCHGKPLPCSVNDTSLCVTQDEANTVYRLGNLEYSYYFRDASNSTIYSALHYGVWVLELKGHLEDKMSGKSEVKYFHNIAHDGSVAPLLGFLQISEMRWPGMGSEVVFELYKNRSSNKFFLRVLWGGQPMITSTPLGTLDMIPIEDMFDYIDSMVGSGSDLFATCNA
ncbi:phosphoglycerate mutase-like protein [Dendrothele bispora CBS 962.96]|uniref:Phosphoglycerate mutase-like protein n=1 Tax=Dendrothele bispora (strain CBS 962.96) TaxID=1314807 RepID=A0A4S8M9X5_DENBC|nr:phosphoglycerate mutase-like protein [Dendrothele bispora CBS 962.96]